MTNGSERAVRTIEVATFSGLRHWHNRRSAAQVYVSTYEALSLSNFMMTPASTTGRKPALQHLKDWSTVYV